jgi:hypothetical protein
MGRIESDSVSVDASKAGSELRRHQAVQDNAKKGVLTRLSADLSILENAEVAIACTVCFRSYRQSPHMFPHGANGVTLFPLRLNLSYLSPNFML